MIARSITNVLKDFEKTCDEVIQNCEPIIITCENDENVVLVSLAEYNNLLENIYLMRSPKNYAHLMESVEQARAGKLIKG